MRQRAAELDHCSDEAFVTKIRSRARNSRTEAGSSVSRLIKHLFTFFNSGAETLDCETVTTSDGAWGTKVSERRSGEPYCICAIAVEAVTYTHHFERGIVRRARDWSVAGMNHAREG